MQSQPKLLRQESFCSRLALVCPSGLVMVLGQKGGGKCLRGKLAES